MAYILKRLALLPFLLLAIATIAFGLSHSAQSDPLVSIIGERQMSNEKVVQAAKERWGLDKSLGEQYVIYIKNLAQGDMGTSFRTRRPVSQDIGRRLPATLELVVFAMLLASVLGVLLGIVSAHFFNKKTDHIIRIVSLLGSSTPVFWSGLIILFIFSVHYPILPGPGRLSSSFTAPPTVTGFLTLDAIFAGEWGTLGNALSHLVLPVITLSFAVMGPISRLVRASMLDVMNEEYVLTARAKGASERRVLINHVFRNALMPTVTIIGFSFAYLITGAVLTEAIFSWPGIGSYAVESARALDYPAIIGVTLVGGVAFVLANLVVDFLYVVIDPRAKL